MAGVAQLEKQLQVFAMPWIASKLESVAEDQRCIIVDCQLVRLIAGKTIALRIWLM